MKTFRHFDLLEAIELWAADNGCISSEQELSDAFDEAHADWLPTVADDWPAISEAFANYADSLSSDCLLHDEQVQHYCYVGKYSKG